MLKSPIRLETAFGEYTVNEILGEGGAGRVYGGRSANDDPVAIKVLTSTASDKRSRFKNEVAFLARNRHVNVVTVTDHGVAAHASLKGPFYVMRRFAGNFRAAMKSTDNLAERFQLYAQILDGVEAAHLQNVVHRDIKPENILWDSKSNSVAVADFGIASFTTDQLATMVETGPSQRLANFQYAAPEQRNTGADITEGADIYALGLILNELFTGAVPHGTDYRLIGAVSPEHAFLDQVVSRMLKQNPAERPASIAALKTMIQKYQYEAVTQQKLDRLTNTVIRAGEVDEPLAHSPPKLIDASWDNNILTLTLDRPVNREWVDALHNLGNYTSVMGLPPQSFRFTGTQSSISCRDTDAQRVIDYFKQWLPAASAYLKYVTEQKLRAEEERARENLQRARQAEALKLEVNSRLRV